MLLARGVKALRDKTLPCRTRCYSRGGESPRKQSVASVFVYLQARCHSRGGESPQRQNIALQDAEEPPVNPASRRLPSDPPATICESLPSVLLFAFASETTHISYIVDMCVCVIICICIVICSQLYYIISYYSILCYMIVYYIIA